MENSIKTEQNLETKNNVSKRGNENLYFTIIYRD